VTAAEAVLALAPWAATIYKLKQLWKDWVFALWADAL
jgi:hypothetical protein